jgi:uncharacterized cofD-like protein
MLLFFRRKLGHKIRARRWVFFLFIGLVMMCLGVIVLAMGTIILAPAGIETIRSFHPAALGLTAITAFLISYYWFSRGLKTAFELLDTRDHSISTKIRDFVFKKSLGYEKRFFVVALGGGTGLSSLLKGIKELPVSLTAIVTVTDDGGSSGRLRKDLQILPPGDIRNCLVALSRSESMLSKLFQHRFSEGGDMEGHSFGNLFIAAMTGILGDFSSAVREVSNILAIKGNVIPVTNENVELVATFEDQTEIVGETAICLEKKPIAKMNLLPEAPAANLEALSAIDDANLIILGPGSLYTSVIPNLLVPGVAEHINDSEAHVVYICNVMTQQGETDSYSAIDHVAAILTTTSLRKIDTVIVNSRRAAKPLMQKYEYKNQFWVPPTVKRIEDLGIRVIATDLLLESDMLRHNPLTLARVILSIITELDEQGIVDETM